jgi:hypothetical protein
MRLTLKPRIVVLDFKEDSCEPGTGRSLAEGVADRLAGAELFELIDRKDWWPLLGDWDLKRKFCFHSAWATGLIALIGADAAIMGQVRNLPGGGQRINVSMVDGRGVVFEAANLRKTDDLAKLLSADRLAKAIRVGRRIMPARIEFTLGQSLLLDVGRDSGLQAGDSLRIDSVLEAVADPFFHEAPRKFDDLIAGVGEAEVLAVGVCLVAVRYSGNSCPKAGDLISLSRN